MESKYALKKFLCKSSQINAQTHLTLPEIDLPLTVHDIFSPRVETGLLTNFHFAVIHCGGGGKPLRWNIQSFGSSLPSMWNLRHATLSLCVCLPNCRTGGRLQYHAHVLYTSYMPGPRHLIFLNPHRINAGRYKIGVHFLKWKTWDLERWDLSSCPDVTLQPRHVVTRLR